MARSLSGIRGNVPRRNSTNCQRICSCYFMLQSALQALHTWFHRPWCLNSLGGFERLGWQAGSVASWPNRNFDMQPFVFAFTWMHPLDKICRSNSVIRCCLRLLVSYLLATWPAMILCWSRKSLTNSRFDSVATPSKKGRRRAHVPEVWFRVLGQQIIRSFSMVCWFVAVAATRFPSECWRLVQPPQPQHLPCRFLFRTCLIDTVPRVCIVFGQGLPRLFLDQELVFGGSSVHQRLLLHDQTSPMNIHKWISLFFVDVNYRLCLWFVVTNIQIHFLLRLFVSYRPSRGLVLKAVHSHLKTEWFRLYKLFRVRVKPLRLIKSKSILKDLKKKSVSLAPQKKGAWISDLRMTSLKVSVHAASGAMGRCFGGRSLLCPSGCRSRFCADTGLIWPRLEAMGLPFTRRNSCHCISMFFDVFEMG